MRVAKRGVGGGGGGRGLRGEERGGGMIKIGFQFRSHGSGALTDADVMLSFLSVTPQM